MSKKIITYARTSTEEQSRHSIEQQQESIQRYCNLHGFTIIKEFREHCSAKDFNRPVFKELYEYAKKKSIRLMLYLFFGLIDLEDPLKRIFQPSKNLVP